MLHYMTRWYRFVFVLMPCKWVWFTSVHFKIKVELRKFNVSIIPALDMSSVGLLNVKYAEHKGMVGVNILLFLALNHLCWTMQSIYFLIFINIILNSLYA